MYPLSLIVIGLRLCWSMTAATATWKKFSL